MAKTGMWYIYYSWLILSVTSIASYSISSFIPAQRNGSGAADSVFLLDKSKISQLSLDNGKIKCSFQSLSNIQAQLCLTAPSASGSVLAGLTLSGKMFIWHQPSQLLSTYTSPLCTQKASVNKFQGVL